MSRRGWFLFISLGIIWGLPYLLIKVAVEDLAPPVLVFCRVVLGSLLLVPIALKRGVLGKVRPVLGWVVLFALLEVSGPWVLLTFAETRVSSSFAALFISAVPLVGATAAHLMKLDDRFDRTRILGLCVGVAGVASLVGLDMHGGSLIAVVALVFTVIGYAFGPIVVSRKLAEVPGVAVIAATLVFNVIIYAPAAIVLWPREAVPATTWGAVAVLGVLCTAIAFLLFFEMILETGPTRTTIITYVNPAVAVLLGIAVLGEPITLGIMIGFPLVLLGSFLATRHGPVMEDEPVPA